MSYKLPNSSSLPMSNNSINICNRLITTKRSPAVMARGFFNLPAELRNTIYKLVIFDTRPQFVLWKDAIKHQPSLLRASSRLRLETRPIYYACVTPMLETQVNALNSFEVLVNDFKNAFLNCTGHIGLLLRCGVPRSSSHWTDWDENLPSHYALFILTKQNEMPCQVNLTHGTLAVDGQHKHPISGGKQPFFEKLPSRLFDSHVPYYMPWTGLEGTCRPRCDLKILHIKLLRIARAWAGPVFEADGLSVVFEVSRHVALAEERLWTPEDHRLAKRMAAVQSKLYKEWETHGRAYPSAFRWNEQR